VTLCFCFLLSLTFNIYHIQHVKGSRGINFLSKNHLPPTWPFFFLFFLITFSFLLFFLSRSFLHEGWLLKFLQTFFFFLPLKNRFLCQKLCNKSRMRNKTGRVSFFVSFLVCSSFYFIVSWWRSFHIKTKLFYDFIFRPFIMCLFFHSFKYNNVHFEVTWF
jgi:hypothetical protein